MKYALIFLCTSLLLFSCGPYKEITISQISQARILKMDKDGVEAEVDVKINNPNKIGFKVFKSDLGVTLNDSPVGSAGLKKKIKIKANSEETYTFVVVGKFDKILASGGLLGLISVATSKTANVGLKGNMKAGKLFYRKTFPIDIKQRIPLTKQ